MGRYGNSLPDHDFRDMDYRGYGQDEAEPEAGFKDRSNERLCGRNNSVGGPEDMPNPHQYSDSRPGFQQNRGMRGSNNNLGNRPGKTPPRGGPQSHQPPQSQLQQLAQNRFRTEERDFGFDPEPKGLLRRDQPPFRGQKNFPENMGLLHPGDKQEMKAAGWGPRPGARPFPGQEERGGGRRGEEDQFGRDIGHRKVRAV